MFLMGKTKPGVNKDSTKESVGLQLKSKQGWTFSGGVAGEFFPVMSKPVPSESGSNVCV